MGVEIGNNGKRKGDTRGRRKKNVINSSLHLSKIFCVIIIFYQ